MSSVFPILDAIPVTSVRDIIDASSIAEGFINPDIRKRFDEPV